MTHQLNSARQGYRVENHRSAQTGAEVGEIQGEGTAGGRCQERTGEGCSRSGPSKGLEVSSAWQERVQEMQRAGVETPGQVSIV